MKTRNTAPVGFTCKDIDATIAALKGAIGEIKDAIDNMEDLRNANQAIRAWGNALVKELQEAEAHIEELTDKLTEADSEVTRLKGELEKVSP